MGTSEFWQRIAASVSSLEREAPLTAESARLTRGTAKFWMACDVVTAFAAAAAATMYEFHAGLFDVAARFWAGTLIWHNPMWALLALMASLRCR